MPLIKILKEAIKAVPAVKFALGVAGLAAAVALVAGFVDYRLAVFGTPIMLLMMFALVLFSWFSKHGSKDFRPLALTLAWASVILIIAVPFLLFTSFFFKWPLNLQQYVTGILSPPTSKSSPSPTPSPLLNITQANSNPSETPTHSMTVTKPAVVGTSQHIRQARSLYAQRKYQAAIRECDEALRIDPGNNEAMSLKKQITNTVKILNQ